MTIQDRFDPRRNSLNFIRLVLASLVIVSHSWPVGGFGDDPHIGDQNLGSWAVAGFFAISGYLITSSAANASQLDYYWRRFLRIYPGYFVALTVVAFGFAPVTAALDGADTYDAGSALSYVGRNLALWEGQTGISGTLSGSLWEPFWNAPLWTLFFEFMCYVAIGVIVATLKGRRRQIAVVVLFVLLSAITTAYLFDLINWNYQVLRMARLGAYFAAGALLYLFRRRVPLRGVIAFAAAVLLVGLAVAGGSTALGGLPVAYLMLYLGVVLPVTGIGQRHDISYGMYIYGFPVQQLLVYVDAHDLGVVGFTIASVLCTVPFAVASRVLVETPADKPRFKYLFRQQRQVGATA